MNQTTKEQGKRIREEIRKSIIEYIEKYGYPPTVRDIGDMTGLKSTSSVKNHLDQMIADGILETDHECSPRAIRIPGYQFVKEEMDKLYLDRCQEVNELKRQVEEFQKAAGHEPKKPKTKEKIKYCYSWDGEDYSYGLYDSKEEAIKAARAEKQEEKLEEKEVFIARAVHPELTWNANEEDIIESMLEDLAEQCGEEQVDGALDDITPEMEVDLRKMINRAVQKWIDKYDIKPACYTVEEFGTWEV